TRNPLERAHGSARWAQGDTVVLAAVYGPRPGTRKGENPEKASVEVVWKPKTGQIGRQEKEYEMTLKRTLQSICLLTVHPNTTTSVILQVMGDDGSLLPCAINASCAALVFAGVPMKHLAGCNWLRSVGRWCCDFGHKQGRRAAIEIVCSPGVPQFKQVC
uniref:Exoribonuclease phosphorolytic domain-containing protein n=1 Tax=Aegilops tauschii subsp. strangulata TaxID=200361 RepID=A0A453MLF2_AEGTS